MKETVKPITINFVSALTIEPLMFLQFGINNQNMQNIRNLMQLLAEHFPMQVELAREDLCLIALPDDIDFLVNFCYYCMLTLNIEISIADQKFAYKQYKSSEASNLKAAIEEFRKAEKIKWSKERKSFGDLNQIIEDVKKYEEEKLEEDVGAYIHDEDDDDFTYSGL